MCKNFFFGHSKSIMSTFIKDLCVSIHCVLYLGQQSKAQCKPSCSLIIVVCR